MSLFKKNKYQDAVEEADKALDAAVASFEAARDAVDAAADTYYQRVEENNAYVQSLVARNVELVEKAERSQRISGKLGDLVA